MQLCELDIKRIKISGDNPRIINRKSENYLELVESIRAMGVKVPIHVRDKEDIKCKGNYELIAGERRLLAADEAGLETIPAINHGELSDDAAFEVTFAENFAREDLTILEQGKAVATLMVKFKNDVAAVASKIGKSEQWVRIRELINSNLSEKWKKLVLEDDNFNYFTAAHLGLVARFPQHIQDKEIVKSLQYCHVTVKELDKKLAEQFLLLKKAPFDTGKCCNCQKRSSCQPTLWAEKAEEVTGDNDRCLDKKCWQNKDVAAAKAELAEVQEKYPGLVYVEMSGCYDGDEVRRLKKIYGRSLSSWQFEKVKKTDKGAVPALVIHGSGKGKVIYIKVEKQGEASASQTCKPKTLKQLRTKLEENRWEIVLKEMYSQIRETPQEKINHPDKLFAVIILAAGLGSDIASDGDCTVFLKKALDLYKKNTSEAIDFVLGQVWKCIQDSLQYSYADGSDKTEIEFGRIIAPLFNIDLDQIYKTVCERDDLKEPGEWADLKADGTPKTAKSKKSKTKEEKPTEPSSEDETQSEPEGGQVRKCRVCGCTEENPCITAEGPCYWVEPPPEFQGKGAGDLCSACDGKENQIVGLIGWVGGQSSPTGHTGSRKG